MNSGTRCQTSSSALEEQQLDGRADQPDEEQAEQHRAQRSKNGRFRWHVSQVVADREERPDIGTFQAPGRALPHVTTMIMLVGDLAVAVAWRAGSSGGLEDATGHLTKKP